MEYSDYKWLKLITLKQIMDLKSFNDNFPSFEKQYQKEQKIKQETYY